jgi:hypothetical protein
VPNEKNSRLIKQEIDPNKSYIYFNFNPETHSMKIGSEYWELNSHRRMEEYQIFRNFLNELLVGWDSSENAPKVPAHWKSIETVLLEKFKSIASWENVLLSDGHYYDLDYKELMGLLAEFSPKCKEIFDEINQYEKVLKNKHHDIFLSYAGRQVKSVISSLFKISGELEEAERNTIRYKIETLWEHYPLFAILDIYNVKHKIHKSEITDLGEYLQYCDRKKKKK